ncbi:MAG TPA: hypothetical protein VFA50_13465 [Stellaceae bacterium]|nr:hypothetical protein [Stellaceae bacterium]
MEHFDRGREATTAPAGMRLPEMCSTLDEMIGIAGGLVSRTTLDALDAALAAARCEEGMAAAAEAARRLADQTTAAIEEIIRLSSLEGLAEALPRLSREEQQSAR